MTSQKIKAIVRGIAKATLLMAVALVVTVWILLSRKVVQVSLGEGRECSWQLNQWYSGRCILSCYEHGIRKGFVRTAKGLVEWPIAAFPGLLPNTVIVIHELDNTIAVFTIDLTNSDPKAVPPPASLSTTVLFSNFKVRACTQAEVGYAKEYISQVPSLCQSTFPLNDCNANPEALKRGLLRAVDMGTIPNEQRTGDFHYDAQPQIPPEN